MATDDESDHQNVRQALKVLYFFPLFLLLSKSFVRRMEFLFGTPCFSFEVSKYLSNVLMVMSLLAFSVWSSLLRSIRQQIIH